MDLRLEGVTPLLMNSGEVDPDSPDVRAFEALAQVRKKSQEQKAQLRQMEWTLCMYYEDGLGPYIPGKNVHEMLAQAATKWRRGADVTRSVVVTDYRIALDYDGPRDIEALWQPDYRYTAMVANAGISKGRVLRTRPKFDEWVLETQLAFDPEDMDADTLVLIVERSQKYGLGDYRTGPFGRFTATLKLGEAVLPAPRLNGSKARNRDEEKAHETRVAATKSVLG